MKPSDPRPKSSQILVCVKDLYRPIPSHPQSNISKVTLSSFRFKLLNFRPPRSLSPYKEKKPKTNSVSCYVNKNAGLIIKMFQKTD